MKILFTVNPTSTVSKLILKLTKEPVSHTAILLDGYVYHSNYKGVNKIKYEDFLKVNEMVFSISPVEASVDEATTKALVEKFPLLEGSIYDLPAILYIGARYILREYLGMRLPKKNLWQVSGMYLCTEFVSDIVDSKVNSNITPYKLYLQLVDSKKWS